MTACEKCWQDAYVRARTLGGSQADHYRALLAERADHPCPAQLSAQYVRDHYKVPAKRGGRIAWTSPSGVKRNATIVGFRGQYLRVRFDDAVPTLPSGAFASHRDATAARRTGIVTLHPTDNVQYLEPTREATRG